MSDDEYGVVPPRRTDDRIEEGVFTEVVVPVAGLGFTAAGFGVAAASLGSTRRTESMTRRMERRDAIRFRQETRDRMPGDD